MARKQDQTTLDGFLVQARERFQLAQDAESQIRKDALDDLKFRAGDQWPEDVKAEREIDRRPSLTVNRLPQFIKQVTNDQRQNRLSIQVNPVDDESDPDTAEILQGIIRHIEVTSPADVAYDTAFEHAATFGFGYFRILTEYADDQSFTQEIKIKRVRNPFSVYLDPAAQELDSSDARWAFIVEDMTEEEYRQTYPDSELAGLNNFTSIGNQAPDWLHQNFVRVAEYFYTETRRRTLVMLEDRNIVYKDELVKLPEGINIPILAEREVLIKTINWCKLNAIEKLEESLWPGSWIPIVPVLGDEIDINGRRDLVGMVRYAKDPQRMYNYWASAETESIALAPRAPFIVAEGQLESYEHLWRQANSRNLAFLPYKPISLAGHPVPPPQRNVLEPPIQAISMARMQSGDDLKSVVGLYDASLGARSNETSGRAIIARQREGDIANFHLADNLSRAIRHGGRIILELIPKIIESSRVARIIGIDEVQKRVQVVNDPNQPAVKKAETGAGKIEKIYNIGVGKYDVTVSSGPSFATKRQDAVQGMIQLTQAYPELVSIAGDLMVKNMDWPGAAEIAERIKRTLPPAIQGSEEEQEIPPQIQAQIDALLQEREMLTQQLQALAQRIDTKEQELAHKERIETMRVAAEERIEAMKVQSHMVETQAKIESERGLEMLKAELTAIRDRIEQLAFGEPIRGQEMSE